MIKYFCDRCGREMKEPAQFRKITFYDKGTTNNRNNITFSLCPDCKEEVLAFAYGYKAKEEK